MTPFTLPQAIDLSDRPLQLTEGSYTDLVNETWNGQDVETDPVLKTADDAETLLTQVPDDPFAAGAAADKLTGLGGSIPGGGASTFSADMAAAQAGMDVKKAAIVGAIQAGPILGELPLNPAGQGANAGPPLLCEVDLGNISLSGPTLDITIGVGTLGNQGGIAGIQNLLFFQAVGAKIVLDTDVFTSAVGNTRYTYHMLLTPTELGNGQVQLNYNVGFSVTVTILTYKFFVVP